MFTNNKLKYESAVITDLINNPQSTHNSIVSNSVGKAILLLRDTYVGKQPTETALDAFVQNCVQELSLVTDLHLKPSIDHILNKIQKPFDPQLDLLSLYLPVQDNDAKCETATYEDVRFILELKEVVALVWKAIHDNERYKHHFEGSEESQLAQASESLELRKNNFFDTLKRIHNNTTCNHGGRNELVFLLNKTYQGISLIEDARGTVLYLLKEHTNNLFWHYYHDANLTALNKRILTTALLQWIGLDNPVEILMLLDPQQAYLHNIKKFFIAHASDPEKAGVTNLIAEALSALEFACDSKRHPMLAMIQKIFTMPVDTVQPLRNAALQLMQNWLLTSYDLTDNNHHRRVSVFYSMFTAHKSYYDFHLLLEITGRLTTKFHDLIETCQSYFEAITKDITASVENTILEEIKSLRSAINACKSDTMANEIENFFARSTVAENSDNHASVAALYALYVNSNFQSKVILNDSDINKLINTNILSEVNNQYWDINPYQINRIFLHGMLVEPHAWSELFKTTFNAVLQFVENNFNETTQGLSSALKKDSYPSYLLTQLHCLNNMSASREVNVADLQWVLPHQVKTAVQWRFVAFHYGNDPGFIAAYESQAIKINRLIAEVVNTSRSLEFLMTIPSMHRMNFLRNCINKNLLVGNLISNFDSLILILTNLIPVADRVDFCLNLIGVNRLLQLIGASYQFEEFLYLFQSNERLGLIKEFGKEFGIDLFLTRFFFMVLDTLTKDDRYAFLMYLKDASILFLESFVKAVDFKVLVGWLKTEHINELLKTTLTRIFIHATFAENHSIDLIRISLINRDEQTFERLRETLNITFEPGCNYASLISEIDHQAENPTADSAQIEPEKKLNYTIASHFGNEYLKSAIQQASKFLMHILELIPRQNALNFMRTKLGDVVIKKYISENSNQFARIMFFLDADDRYQFLMEFLGLDFLKTLLHDKDKRSYANNAIWYLTYVEKLRFLIEFIPDTNLLSLDNILNLMTIFNPKEKSQFLINSSYFPVIKRLITSPDKFYSLLKYTDNSVDQVVLVNQFDSAFLQNICDSKDNLLNAISTNNGLVERVVLAIFVKLGSLHIQSIITTAADLSEIMSLSCYSSTNLANWEFFENFFTESYVKSLAKTAGDVTEIALIFTAANAAKFIERYQFNLQEMIIDDNNNIVPVINKLNYKVDEVLAFVKNILGFSFTVDRL